MDTSHEPSKRHAEPSERQWSQAVEEGVLGALQRLRLPRRDQLIEAGARIERLGQRVARLERGSGS